MSGRREHSAYDSDDGRPKKKQRKIAPKFPSIPDVVKDALDKHVPAMLQETYIHFHVVNKKITAEELDDLLPTAQIGPDWTAADEAQMQQEWDQDPMTPLLVKVPKANRSMRQLWSCIPRLMRGFFAEEIIGPQFDLKFERDPTKSQPVTIAGQRVYSPTWTEEFCKALYSLVHLPLWRGNPGTMAMCLQYVVKCRTNDQRQMLYPRQNYTDSVFFTMMQDVHSNFQDGTKSVRELHRECRRQMRGVDCLWSDLFLQVEYSTLNESGQLRAPNPGLNFEPYPVRTSDVTNLIKAVEALESNGYPWFLPAEVATKMMERGSQETDAPNEKNLEDCRVLVLKNLRREAMKASRLNLRHPSHASVPGHPIGLPQRQPATQLQNLHPPAPPPPPDSEPRGPDDDDPFEMNTDDDDHPGDSPPPDNPDNELSPFDKEPVGFDTGKYGPEMEIDREYLGGPEPVDNYEGVYREPPSAAGHLANNRPPEVMQQMTTLMMR
ncbi:hypothetical protein F5Y18DRAFT_431203 [Xylariaceae sp. FL1019]|nr:hypothetical protein F5Y18DRAFT_431203 [Xylariaceae sp. FL1019]